MNAENKFLWSLEMLTKKLAEDSVFFKGNFEAIQNDVLSPSVDVNEKKLYDEVISMFSNL